MCSLTLPWTLTKSRKWLTRRPSASCRWISVGLPSNVRRLKEIAESAKDHFQPTSEVQQKLCRPLVMLDAAHSLGAKYGKGRVGVQADISGFSFPCGQKSHNGGRRCIGHLLCLARLIPRRSTPGFNIMSLHGQSKDALSKSKAGSWRYDVIEPGIQVQHD